MDKGWERIKEGSNGKIGFPVDCSSNPGVLWLLMNFAERILLDPVKWTIDPDFPRDLPDDLKKLKPTKEEILIAALDCFYMNVWEFNTAAREQNDILEAANLASGFLTGFYIRIALEECRKSRKPLNEYNLKAQITAATVVDLYRDFVLMAMGKAPDQSGQFEKVSAVIAQLREDLQHPVVMDPHIKALLDGIQDKPLIVKIPGTEFFIKNPNWNGSKKGNWYEKALVCFERAGLTAPNWAELGRKYIRQKNGKAYQNIARDIKLW